MSKLNISRDNRWHFPDDDDVLEPGMRKRGNFHVDYRRTGKKKIIGHLYLEHLTFNQAIKAAEENIPCDADQFTIYEGMRDNETSEQFRSRNRVFITQNFFKKGKRQKQTGTDLDPK